MIDTQSILWALVVFIGGVLLGGVYFGGLWLTARRFVHFAIAPLLIVASFLIRTALVLLGMYWLTGADWWLVLVCLGGLLLARQGIVCWVLRSSPLEGGMKI